MNYYKYKNYYLASFLDYDFPKISLEEARKNKGQLYFLKKLDPLYSRRSFIVSDSSLLKNEREDISLLKKEESLTVDGLIDEKIKERKLISINTSYPTWEEALERTSKNKYRVNLLALGDVGSNLAIGLRLLGGENIEELGIYDRNPNRLNRWIHELNQVNIAFDEDSLPQVKPLSYEELFDCDIFVFCASRGIPDLDSDIKDVRMAQFESNSEIVKEYAGLARKNKFKGLFALVSDPVDLLCKVAFLESNKDKEGQLDFRGLAADQIIGYGLGVMNARAVFYADQMGFREEYIEEGRVFGPHGKGLVAANSIDSYDPLKSDQLTQAVLDANLVVRSFGYKPYIAPSLSSGSLALIKTCQEDYFYGSSYMAGAYMGSKLRLVNGHIELERLELDKRLYKKLQATHGNLVDLV